MQVLDKLAIIDGIGSSTVAGSTNCSSRNVPEIHLTQTDPGIFIPLITGAAFVVHHFIVMHNDP